MNPILAAEISRLTPCEKLDLIEEVWSTLDADGPSVPPAVATELDRRWAEHVRNPNSALELEELMSRVEAKRR